MCVCVCVCVCECVCVFLSVCAWCIAICLAYMQKYSEINMSHIPYYLMNNFVTV